MALEIVILAAGRGTRMHSAIPKVLHKLAGKCLLEHVIATAKKLQPLRTHIVYHREMSKVREYFIAQPLNWIEQREQLGTGDALRETLAHLRKSSEVLVLYGDVPLIDFQTVKKMIAALRENELVLLSDMVADPSGFGRIVRDAKDNVKGIVEHRDAKEDELKIREINSGILATKVEVLSHYLPLLTNRNANGEYYLTDIVGLLVSNHGRVKCLIAENSWEVAGVNNKMQLATLERIYQRNLSHQLMLDGLMLMDPERFDVRGDLKLGRDVVMDVNVVIEGNVTIGDGTFVGQNVFLKDSKIGANVVIKPNSVIEGATVGDNCVIGPFARVRPETRLAAQVRVGNFVELKKSILGKGSKVSHLSYVGDSIVGTEVNLGAGTVTCNYDGVTKHQTTIEDGAFIGSNSSLVAPVTIGKGAFIGAGSVITRNAPAHKLTLTRAEQVTRAEVNKIQRMKGEK